MKMLAVCGSEACVGDSPRILTLKASSNIHLGFTEPILLKAEL